MSLKITFSQALPDGPYTGPDFESLCLESFEQMLKEIDGGFYDLHNNAEDIKASREVYESFKSKRNFIQIGIGGSALGPQMLLNALGEKYKNERVFRFLDNIDPDYIQAQLSDLSLNESLFYVVSKSGATAETVAGLAIVINKLKEAGIDESQFKDYFVFCTDPKKSLLKDLGTKFQIQTLSVPSNVGGRFSVLTPVGLLPALFANIPVEKLFVNHESLKKDLLRGRADLVKMGSQILYHQDKGLNQTVLMPYCSDLKSFSAWFVQLWAESLGKKHNKAGQEVNLGLTPIAAYGASDQHAQVQLFMEGPKDKYIIFIKVQEFAKDFSLNCKIDDPIFKKLGNIKLSQLMDAELVGTQKALREQDRPYCTIEISRLNATSLGELILFFESLTALVGIRMGIDPFNQPGVEAGKIYANEWLAQR